MAKRKPRYRRQPATRRDLVTHNRNIGAPLSRNQSYGCGLTEDCQPAALFPCEMNESHALSFNNEGLVGGVPETPKEPPRKTCGCLRPWSNDRGLSQRCLFFFVIRRGTHSGPRQTRSSFKRRMPGCQPGDAGASPAGRTNFQYSIRRASAAQFDLQNRTSSGRHRDAVPFFGPLD